MSRPKEKLIDRQSIVQAAINRLEISGLDGFNLRQLGKDLNVNPASIYHYFESKEDILRAAAGRLLREAVTPSPGEAWPNWFAQASLGYYRLLVGKPFLIPIMLAGYRPRTEVSKRNAEHLAKLGVPESLRPDIVRALEGCVIGLALIAVSKRDGEADAGDKPRLDLERVLTQTVGVLLERLIAEATAESEPSTAAVDA